jgi:hypothetical protein
MQAAAPEHPEALQLRAQSQAGPLSSRLTARILRVKSWLLACLLVVILSPSAYLCWQARDGSQLGYFQDDELYLTAAKSLVETGTYKIPSLPTQPYQTKYPPLYPMLLAAVWKLSPAFPSNLPWFVLLDWFVWAGFLTVAFTAFRRLQLHWMAQWGALTLLALNGACHYMTVHFMPEALFSTFVLAAILLAETASRADRPAVATVCAAVAAGFAFLTKTAALPLALTVPLVFLYRRQYGRAVCFTIVLAPFIAGWMIWAGTHRGHFSDPVLLYYTDYVGFYKFNVQWRDIPSLVRTNFPYLQGSFIFALPQWPRPIALAGIITAAVSLVGTVRLLTKTKFLHAAAFGIAYILELLAWHFPPSGRFLFPLFPFLVAGFAYEVGFAIDLVRKALPARWDVVGRVVCSVALGLMLVSVVLTSWEVTRTLTMHDLSHFRRDTANRRAAYAWINKSLPTDAKFAAYDDVGLYLYTGREGIRNQVMSRPYILADMEGVKKPIAAMGDFARQYGLAYLLWSPDDYAIDSMLQNADLRERLLARNTGLRLVYNAQNVRVYRVE